MSDLARFLVYPPHIKFDGKPWNELPELAPESKDEAIAYWSDPNNWRPCDGPFTPVIAEDVTAFFWQMKRGEERIIAWRLPLEGK